MKKKKAIELNEIEIFCDEHIQLKVDEGVLSNTGLDANSPNFKRELAIYKSGLFEGVINGLSWAGKEINGLEEII